MRRILDLGRDVCTELFQSYGVAIDPPSMVPVRPSESCAVIGFAGRDLKGSLVLAASPEVLAQTNPLAGSPRPDWVGELANQLAGRLKNRLLDYGVEVYVTTPIPLRGLEITPLSVDEHVSQSTGWGAGVWLWIYLEPSPGFTLSEPVESIALAEGASMLFF